MEDFEWNVLNECKLLESMVGFKPVGVSKHFQMVCIWEKMTEEHNINVSPEQIWSHLATMYNLKALDEIEVLPFPNDEREFYLPESEFGSLKVKKEEKVDDKTGKSPVKRIESKDNKKEEKTPSKKDNQRSDSKDSKDIANTVVKKEIKKEIEKAKPTKGRSTPNTKEDDKTKTPKLDESLKRQNRRPTRGSLKPEDINLSLRKSQSPLTVTSTPPNKRRRI